MKDTYKHQGLRRKLVREIMDHGITNERVLKAFSVIPRHFFFETLLERHAYENKPFPIGCDQTISQPYTVAFQSELLQAEPGMKVLEIGTGSGYQACVLAEMGLDVYSVEIIEELHLRTKNLLKELNYNNIKLFLSDGSLGLPEEAPFDRILVTAAAPEISTDLAEQLKIGGKMVIPVGGRNQQTMYRVTRISKDDYESEKFQEFRFVPLTGKKGF